MPSIRRCVFGCYTTGITVHKFPNPNLYPERFQIWVDLAGASVADMTTIQIYKNRRVCDKHFADKDRNRNNRLNALAIPHLHIPRADNVILHVFPNPAKDPNRFKLWVNAIGGNLHILDSKTVFGYYRVCHTHFTERDHTWSNRLSPDAVPTLYLKGQTVHSFPNPKKLPEQFKIWVELGGEQLKNLSVEEIYPRIKVCNRHFIQSHQNRNNRLSALAIPTLHLNHKHHEPNVRGFSDFATKMNTNPTIDMQELSLDQGLSENDTPSSVPEPLCEESSRRIRIVAGPLHHFPKPEWPNMERFINWKTVLREETQAMGDTYLFNQVRLCYRHFETYYCLPSKLLTRNAIPTLNLGCSGQVISTEVSSLVMPELDVSSAANRIQTDSDDDIDQDGSLPELTTDNVSSTSIDNELLSEPETSRAIIARVYHYLQKEYECLKSLVGGSCDVSPFADILRRTAEATGVTENTVTSVLQESKCAEQHNDLDNNTSTHESLLHLKCETYKEDTPKTDTALGDDVYILDLREKDAVNTENENRQCTLMNNSQLPSGFIKSNFVVQSAVKESDGTNSENLRKLQRCRWCSVRKRGYNKNLWMCKQCKVSLCLNKCFKNCCRVRVNN